MTQRFVNRESQPIEAVYVFPLDEGAAVCGFEAMIDGRLVVGEVKEREEAFRIYDDAMERGDGAFLLDEERPDVFQASVGNLPPGKEVAAEADLRHRADRRRRQYPLRDPHDGVSSLRAGRGLRRGRTARRRHLNPPLIGRSRMAWTFESSSR